VSELQENLTRIRSRIDQACERSGRQLDSVRLMAVSKNQPPERVAEAALAGLTLFGENRIQDAKVKIPLCPGQLEWHFIGHLQSNKSRDAVSLFQVVQGVDSLALAEELQKQALKQARSLPILLEVNVAGESSKFGWNPDRLLAELPQLNALNRLEVHGLMTIAPYAVDPEQVRPIFRRLRELRDRCTDLLGAPLPVLSMGMSGDLEVAIEEGATLVRVGTALFGERPRRTEADNPPGASNSVG
jgi:pyridoxal phosphate enzyme (YggS family)